MSLHPLAAQPAPKELLIDPGKLEREFYECRPDATDPRQRVSFGTSGHRGMASNGTFNEAHILAITQAICDYRRAHSISGPLFLGKDTHALSAAAERTAFEVLAANQVEIRVAPKNGVTPTPAISHAILTHNRGQRAAQADGIVITPSHNPPEYGGFKYNSTNGGPADTDVTDWIQARANQLLEYRLTDVKRQNYETARRSATARDHDFVGEYVNDLPSVIDVEAIRTAKVRIGVDPLGGSSVGYWPEIAAKFQLDLTVVNARIDPTFAFMTVDHDGAIRMDCSSPYAMAGLVKLKDQFDVACGSDPDADRHGIVTPSAGLMNPNHYLAVAIRHLIETRSKWSRSATIGKTIVSSSLIDRVTSGMARKLWEVPVGFKWFTPGLFDGTCCFGGEESAGASFLRMDGTAWSTDKDGIILGLLAAEILARSGKDPGGQYRELTQQFGEPYYRRIDAPATVEQKNKLKKLSSAAMSDKALAGDPIVNCLSHAPGNGAPIGGIKVVTHYGWFAARPSGTEDIYKLYAESFRSAEHLENILLEAQKIIAAAVAKV